jgi:hypothetical protein
MKKNEWMMAVIVLIVVVIVAIGVVWYCQMYPAAVQPGGSTPTTGQSPTGGGTPTNQSSSLVLSLLYRNTTYGFTFALPADWQGYSIVTTSWQGYKEGTETGTIVATGTELLVRNPLWTAANRYEDIPVMIFTTAQWKSYEGGSFSVSAAPFDANELGSNNKYAFAIPPRWDFDYRPGYKEADEIVGLNPLKGFNL